MIWNRASPIETTFKPTWSKDFPRAIRRFRKSVPVSEPGHVVYAGDLEPSDEDYSAIHFSKLAAVFSKKNEGDAS